MEGVAADLGVQELNQEKDLFLKEYKEINFMNRFDNGWNENSMNLLIKITSFFVLTWVHLLSLHSCVWILW